MSLFPVSFEEGFFDDDHIGIDEIEKMALEKIIEAFEQKYAHEVAKVKKTSPGMDADKLGQNALRGVMAQKVDQLWQEHLLTMDHLRSEVNLRTVGQRDPLLEFKHEAFKLFHELTRRLNMETARNLFKVEIATMHPALFQDLLAQIQLETNRMIFDEMPQEVVEREAETTALPPFTAVNTTPRLGRNDLCPCNSGKKYKKCCGEDPGSMVNG